MIGKSSSLHSTWIANYYPFGLTFNSYTKPGTIDQKYKYQGKEEQEELQTLDFEARTYDQALGRTWQIDPHAENFHEWSGYSWTGDNPIKNIDPTGMDWYQDADGNAKWVEGNDEIEGYTNVGASYSYRSGGITYSFDQNDLSTIEEHVLEKSEWETSQTKNSDGSKKQCFAACEEMVTASGGTMLGGTDNGILTGTETKTKDGYKVTPTTDVRKGFAYINSQIEKGKSVGIGVDYVFGKGINEKTTDHWVAIASRLTNLKTNLISFKFYDPGTSWVNKGTNSSNVFSLNGELITGKTNYSGRTYTVSQVRKNKP